MKASNSARFFCQAAFALGSLFAAGMPAHGQGVPGYPDDVRFGFDPREVSQVPRYCIYTQYFNAAVPGANDKAEIQRWYLIMGPSFNAVHHYCWGLMKTNRALFLVSTRQLRTFYLTDAIAEFDYVINRVPPEFKLLPEILTKKGENLIRLDKGPQGVRELERAIELRPDYWPPYVALSDYYATIGDRASARKWLEQGLSTTPDVKALKRRLAELDTAEGNRVTAPQAVVPKQPLKP